MIHPFLHQKRYPFGFGFVLFLVMISGELLAQAGKYELRFVQESVNCITRTVVFSAQIRATSAENQFIMGPASLLFEVPTTSLSNPVLLSKDKYSGGRYSELTLNTQGSISTLSIVFQGGAPYTDVPNVTTDWSSIAHISYTIPPAADGCYALNWKTNQDFPGSEVFEVVISGGTASFQTADPQSFQNTAGCALAALLPVATLTGDTTIYDGELARLKVSFNGSTPISIALNGITYSNLSQSPLLVDVFPSSTNTYTIDSVFNACGKGTVQGSATVTVLQPALTTLDLAQSTVCAGTTVQVPFSVVGNFGAGNTFAVQLSDATGTNFTTIPTTGSSSPLTATIPLNTPAGSGYRVRVVSSNPAVTGTPSGTFAVSTAPTAVLSGGATIPAGSSANLTVALTGKAPWLITLSDNSTRTLSTSPAVVSVSPAATTTYSLLSVTDACFSGTVSGSATVTVLPAEEPCKPLCVPVTFRIIKQ